MDIPRNRKRRFAICGWPSRGLRKTPALPQRWSPRWRSASAPTARCFRRSMRCCCVRCRFPTASNWSRGAESAQEPAAIRRARAAGRLEPRSTARFKRISGYYAQDDSELSGESAREAEARVRGAALLASLGRLARARPRFHPAGGALWRTQRGTDQRPLVAPPIQRPAERDRQSAPLRQDFPPDYRRDAGVASYFPNASRCSGPRARPMLLTRIAGVDLVHRHRPSEARRYACPGPRQFSHGAGQSRPPVSQARREYQPRLKPLKESTVGGVQQSLWILFGSVSLLLLIACTNIAALLLSRAAGRRRKSRCAFRSAPRALPWPRSCWPKLVLALAGAVLGLAVATGASDDIPRAGASDLPRIEEIGLDWRIVLYPCSARSPRRWPAESCPPFAARGAIWRARWRRPGARR